MIKRLRIKFIAVVMSVVTILFIVIFGLVLHLTKRNIERESVQAMRTMAFRPPAADFAPRPDDKPKNVRLPFFTINISDSGELTAFGGDYYDLTDEDSLRKLVAAVDEEDGETGVLSDYDLRYLKVEAGRGRAIVFADISNEKAMMRGLVRNSLIIGFVGYIAFFLISLLLAKWVTKPVERTWNEQKQFIADASHELKTPLTIITTNAEMLGDEGFSETEKEGFAQNILSTSKRMRGLVEGLLELARLDNNKTIVKFGEIDYSKLINDCLLTFEPLFYENNMKLSAAIEEGVSVCGDKEKLSRVVNILLDNALKYSDPSEKVSVELKRQQANCLLSVKGKGAELSKEECENIFKRFYRADPSRNDGRSYGLGLSIAEGIIREHNGRIWAESEGGFNTFFVSLQA